MNKSSVTILNAGPGMGFYVPGVIMERQLLAAGISVQLHVFESFYKGEKKSVIPKMKQKFHKSFSFALMGQNMANDPANALDENLVSALLNQWIKEERQYFIVFSGFWLSILNRFLEMTNRTDIKVDLCHLDADYSVSWKMYNCNLPTATTQWFHSWEEKKINYYMDVDGLSPLPFSQRRNNLVIHGGGWGLGDFAAKADDLMDTNFIRSLIVYEDTAIDTSIPNTEFYLLDPKWNIWEVNDDHQHTFPPLSYIDKQHNNQIKPLDHTTASPLYNIVKNSKAIISKPGAGTLIDSLSASTPLIILEPYGNSENKNGLLWKEHGLGISFEDWKKTNFSMAILEQMHLNLLNIRSTATNYITSYIKNHGL